MTPRTRRPVPPGWGVVGPPPRRLVRPTTLFWALLFVLMLLLGGLSAALTVRAEEEEPTRYQPSTRSPREAVQELAEAHFAPEWVGWAVRTAGCESSFDLYAYSAGFDRRWGVFYAFWGALQVDSVTWGRKARELFDGDLSEPAVNFAMASWIVRNYGSSHWPYCGR